MLVIGVHVFGVFVNWLAILSQAHPHEPSHDDGEQDNTEDCQGYG
jgi:hypothetical protein